MSGPLTDVTVVDFSHGVAGPYCSMYLADLGARVLKVERPSRGDGARYMSVSPRFSAGIPETGGDYFLSINRNKESVALDLKDEAGIELAKALIGDADVVLENFSSGVMEKLGLGYDALSSLNPSLIYCAIRAYGEEGPLADEVGMDVAVQARSGVMSITGYPGSRPVKPGSSLSDLAAGLNATIGIVAALHERTSTGQGRRVDVSLLDATEMMLVNYSVPVLDGDVDIAPMGSGHPQLVPFQAFETRDSWVVIAAGTNSRWRQLCGALGMPELAQDDRFRNNPDRVTNRDELVPILEHELQKRDTAYWLDIFKEEGVPSAPILGLKDAFRQEQNVDSGMLTHMDHPKHGRLSQLASPIVMDGIRCEVRLPAPRLGEHTRSILLNHLGLTEDEVASLESDGVIEALMTE